jgi:hypothetical protein
MDFFERLLGISPDAGSGASELMFLLAPMLIIALVIARRYRRRTKLAANPRLRETQAE